jgi:hypothetical protein
MFQDVLDKIITEAENMYDDIVKNKSEFDDLYHFSLYNFSDITKEKIDNIKDRHIENVKYFLNYISLIDIFDNNNLIYEQFNDILSDDELQIFKIKNLLDDDISEYINKTEQEIIDEINNTINDLNIIDKIVFYCDIYNNKLVKEYINLIKNNNINNNKIINNESEQINSDNICSYDLSKIDELMGSFKNDDLNILKIDTNTWNDNVVLYRFQDKKYNNIYIYFDIFYRDTKKEQTDIIKLKNLTYCINKYYNKLEDNEIENIKKLIQTIIKQ